jgi:hypothetical protein
MTTAYTIGDSDVYEALFADETLIRVNKLGRSEGYEGGIVFQTYEEAADYACGIGPSFKVYGLVLPCSWSEGTYLHADGCHRLLNSAQIVRFEGEV